MIIIRIRRDQVFAGAGQLLGNRDGGHGDEVAKPDTENALRGSALGALIGIRTVGDFRGKRCTAMS